MKKFKRMKIVVIIIGVLIVAAAIILTKNYLQKPDSQAVENTTESSSESTEATVQSSPTEETKEVFSTDPTPESEEEAIEGEGGMEIEDDYTIEAEEEQEGVIQ